MTSPKNCVDTVQQICFGTFSKQIRILSLNNVTVACQHLPAIIRAVILDPTSFFNVK